MFQPLHSSITFEIWKRSARQIRSCCALAALPALLDPDLKSVIGPPGLLSRASPGVLPCRLCLCSMPTLGLPVRARLYPSSCVSVLPSRLSRSEQLWHLAFQLASVASLEDVVTHSIQSVLDPPRASAACAPSLPLALSHTQGRSEPPLVNFAQPSRPYRPGGQKLPSSPARTIWLLPPPTSGPAQLAPPPCPWLTARLLAQLARRSSSGVAEARRRSRDKRWRRTRKQVKMYMWREIQPEDRGCSAMWACCDDTQYQQPRLALVTPSSRLCC